MNNEYYGAPTTPNDDYLAHYGVKGMKWGVRKAIASGSDRRLSRQFRKDMKKLQKLENRANNGRKYVKRAAALGAGAAAAGGLAALGTQGVGNIINKSGKWTRDAMMGYGNAAKAVGTAVGNYANAPGRMNPLKKKASAVAAGLHNTGNAAIGAAGKTGVNVSLAGDAVKRWGRKTHDVATAASNVGGKYGVGELGNNVGNALNKRGLGKISNNTLTRIGAGAVGAGLAGAAGYNAYRAATTKKAAKKAAQFRSEMQKAYSGTRYANLPRNQKKRRRG